jgi:hypothetical protein
MSDGAIHINGWERALIAAETVKQRLRRATSALDAAETPYAVVGGNAVAEWVARIDEEAVRTTRVINLLIRRFDLPAARAALEAAGFGFQHDFEIHTFVDGLQGKPSGGVHLVFAGGRVRRDDEYASPDVDESERAAEFQVVTLNALARIKLIAFRRKDQVHLLDMIGVGWVDATCTARFPPPLGARLQQLTDDPNG